MSHSTHGMSGKLLGAYRILDEIGSGGMGTVYRAEVQGKVSGLAQGDLVALKVIHAHLLKIHGFFKRFLREGEVGKRIRHPNVVVTYDLDGIAVGGETVLYLAMEYVEGQTLWSLFQELGPVPEELLRHLGREVAKGLAAIHAQGVIHRDLKPENILVAKDHRIKLMDLGIARLADGPTRISQTGTFVGSALYAAPEQFGSSSGAVDARADLYSLGVVLYELASGTHPYDADDLTSIVKRLMTETPRRLSELNPQISPFFEEVVGTMLAKERDGRFASAEEVLSVLSEGEKSEWWKARARAIRAITMRPLRRIRVPRETALFGRDAETTRLSRAFAASRSGDGQLVLVEGEAGIGKSRLVDEFAGALHDRGEDVNLLFGGFPPGGAATAFGAFAAALTGSLGLENLEESLAAHLTETPVLVPAFAALLRGDALPAGAEPLTQESLMTVFVHVLRSLAAARPTILVIEDLHFAPPQGLALFASVALAVPGHRLLLVGTARPGLPETWTASMVRMRHALHLTLPRLGLKDIARLLIAAVGSERLADEIGFPIVLKSDGNPFFLFEILRSLRESKVLAQDESGTWRATRVIRDVPIPSSIQEIVNARIAALSDEERDVLEVAACCGFEFDPRLVCDAMGADRVTVLKRLAKIERAHRLVHPLGDRFVFDHHEVHQALYTEVSEALRSEYHAALAKVLESQAGEVGTEGFDGVRAVEVADHYVRAGQGTRARRHLSAALAHLDRTYAGDTAAELAARVLDAPGLVTGSERIELLLQQGARLGLLGRYEAEHTAAEMALQLAGPDGDVPLRARALIALARSNRHVSRHDEVLPRLAEALRLAEQSGSKEAEAAARGVYGEVLCELGRYGEAMAHHERELALWRELGDATAEASALGKLGHVHYVLGRYDEAYAHFVRDLTLNRKTRCRVGRAQIKRNLGDVLYALGRYADARAHFARCLTLSKIIGYRHGEAMALVQLGEVDLVLGELGGAERHLSNALALCRETGIRFVQGQALHALASAAAARGQVRKAFRHAQQAIELRREIGDRAGLIASLLAMGRMRRTAGTVKSARKAFAEALDLARSADLPAEKVLATTLLAVLPGGDRAAAAAALESNQKCLKVGDRMEVHYLLWLATGAPEHLAEAKRLLDYVMGHVPSESRDAALSRAPLHRSIAAA